MNNKNMYAIKFKPVYYERIWGGNSISKILDRKIDIKSNNIGESWDIVDREEACSIVSNGFLEGLSIKDLRFKFGDLIFGNKLNLTSPFPVLVKVLDAKEDLSLQVHPKKSDLAKLNSSAQSKTEFWYILKHNKNAKIYAGLKNCDKNIFLHNLKVEQLKELLIEYDSKENMLIYVPSGNVHSIGSGNLILEIQENSDTTYRVYDWGRIDKNGKKRDLHINESLQCIDFNTKSNVDVKNINIYKTYKVVDNLLFTTLHYYVNKHLLLRSVDAPQIVSVVSGSLVIKCGNNETFLNYGESALLPANYSYDVLKSTKNSRFLLTTTKVNYTP